MNDEKSTSRERGVEGEGAAPHEISYLLTSVEQSTYEGGDVVRDADSDIDNLDFNNFKGIYFDEDPNRKYQDPETGCHFEYYDLCKRLAKLKQLRRKLDEQLGLPPETPEDRKGIYQPNH